MAGWLKTAELLAKRLKQAGKIKSIGVSNMSPKIYSELVPQFSTLPAVNQVECNPTFQQKELRSLMEKDGVKLEAWYPLGHGNRKLLENSAIVRMAQKYGKNKNTARMSVNYIRKL